MTFLPVVVREMSVAARRPSTYWGRAGAALSALVVSGWVLLLASPFVTPTHLGRQLFVVLSYTGFAFALFAGLFATADCISEEKREGTLGLLFLTDLRSYDVILGKLSAGSLNAAFALCGLVPMIALGMLMGGVTLWDVGLMALALANALFLALGLGVFISTISTNERRAMFAGVVTLFALTVGPFVIAFSAMSPAATEICTWLSPVYPVLAVHLKTWTPMGFTGASWQASLLLHHLLGWLFLICSWAIVPLLINDLPALRLAGVQSVFDRMVYGSQTVRARHRARLLDRNAFLWLVSRERVKPRYAWVFVTLFTGMYLWVAWKTPNLLWDVAINASIIAIIHATLKVWICSEVCSRLIQDRRSGALELLLTTPLGVKEIARGQSLALNRIFFWPVAYLAAAEMYLAWRAFHDGFVSPPPADRALAFLAAAGMLVLDAWALKWLGLWLSAWGKSIERVLLATVARGLAVPTLVFASVYFGARMFSQILGVEFSFRSMLLWWLGINAAYALGYGLLSRWKFLRYFRHCAAGRVEGKAPRSSEMVAEVRPVRTGGRMPSWVREHPVAATIVIGLALAIAAGGGRRAFWQWRVSAARTDIRAAKQPVSLAELASYIPKPPPGVDAGRVLMEAGLPANVGEGWNVWYGMLANNADRTWGPEGESLRETLQGNQRQLKAVLSITDCVGFYLPNEMLGMDLERFAVLACIEYLNAVDEGQIERACRSVDALIDLATLLRNSPQPQAQHHACLVLRDLTFALQRRASIPPPKLAEIALNLEKMNNDAILREQLIVQRAFFLGFVPGLWMVPGQFQNPSPANVQSIAWANAALNAVGSGHKRLYGLIEGFDFALKQVADPFPDRLDALQSWRIPMFVPWNAPVRTSVDPLRSAIAQVFWTDAEFTARANVLKTAIAFQRYQSKWGFLPDKLDDLVPVYLREVPKDPFSGEPLRVKKGREWIIYSVGPNRSDDGGAHQLNSESTDWGFRYRFGP